MPEGTAREQPIVTPADSAIAHAVKDPVSRRKFMALTGSSAALAAILAACGSDGGATATELSASQSAAAAEIEQFGKGDIGILNFALSLEYLETAFYKAAIKSGLFKGAELETIKKFGGQEDEHVVALTAAVKQMGGTPAPMPKTRFPMKDAKSVLELASTLENLGAAAYLGQLTNIESPDVLALVLGIHSVEGRHASVFKGLNSESITQFGALEKPLDATTVLNSVEPFIVN